MFDHLCSSHLIYGTWISVLVNRKSTLLKIKASFFFLPMFTDNREKEEKERKESWAWRGGSNPHRRGNRFVYWMFCLCLGVFFVHFSVHVLQNLAVCLALCTSMCMHGKAMLCFLTVSLFVIMIFFSSTRLQRRRRKRRKKLKKRKDNKFPSLAIFIVHGTFTHLWTCRSVMSSRDCLGPV